MDDEAIERVTGRTNYDRSISASVEFGLCLKCGESKAVLCMDSSEGEYVSPTLCGPCISGLFSYGGGPEAPERAVLRRLVEAVPRALRELSQPCLACDLGASGADCSCTPGIHETAVREALAASEQLLT
jgi:hypothetical protein